MEASEIGSKLEDCENVKDIPRNAGGPGFSQWALDFLGSIREQFDENGSLSEKQCAKLGDLWDDI